MSELIRQRFRESGMSIKQLSIQSGVYYSAVHGFINGNRDATLRTAERLCAVLGLELRPARQAAPAKHSAAERKRRQR